MYRSPRRSATGSALRGWASDSTERILRRRGDFRRPVMAAKRIPVPCPGRPMLSAWEIAGHPAGVRPAPYPGAVTQTARRLLLVLVILLLAGALAWLFFRGRPSPAPAAPATPASTPASATPSTPADT